MITEEGTIANAFPISKTNSIQEVELKGALVEITNNFNKDGRLSLFSNAGLLVKGKVYTTKTEPNYDGKKSLEAEKDKLLSEAFNNLTKEEQDLIRISTVIGEQTDSIADKQEIDLEIDTGTYAN